MSILRSVKWAFAGKEMRIKMVEESNDQEWLAKVVLEDKEWQITKAAAKKLSDEELLAKIIIEFINNNSIELRKDLYQKISRDFLADYCTRKKIPWGFVKGTTIPYKITNYPNNSGYIIAI